MRTIKIEQPNKSFSLDDGLEWSVIDWKDDPQTVMKEIDHILESKGLEIVLLDDGSDSWAFSIDKRKSDAVT